MDTFWKWFFFGSGSRAGIRNILNLYFIIHVFVAGFLTATISLDPFAFASKALFPAAAILIGMSMAWTTRAATVMQSEDLRKKIFTKDRPAEDYVYGFQLAMLVVILMVVVVAIMAGGGLTLQLFGRETDRNISGYVMYLLLSISVRECWGVVNFTNMLSMLDYRRPE